MICEGFFRLVVGMVIVLYYSFWPYFTLLLLIISCQLDLVRL